MTYMPDMPDDSVLSLLADDQYLHEVHCHERLSEEEIVKYLERVVRGVAERSKPVPNQWVLNLAKDARDRVVEHYQPLVIALARRALHRFTHCQLMDLIQEGNIGLLSAFDGYAQSCGKYSFLSIAVKSIKDALWAVHFQGESELAVPHSQFVSGLHKLRRAQAACAASGKDASSVEVLSSALNMDEKRVAKLLELQRYDHVSSLQASLTSEQYGQEWEQEGMMSLFEADHCLETVRQEKLREVLSQAFETVLSPPQKRMLHLRFALLEEEPGQLTHKEIAEKMGYSKGGVSYLEESGLERLREVLRLYQEQGEVLCEIDPGYQDVSTVFEASQRCGLSEGRMVFYITSGKIPAHWRISPTHGHKEWMITHQDLEAFLSWHAAKTAGFFDEEGHLETHYTVKQVAKLLEVDSTTVRRYIAKKKLPSIPRENLRTRRLMHLVPKQAVHALLSAEIPSIVA